MKVRMGRGTETQNGDTPEEGRQRRDLTMVDLLELDDDWSMISSISELLAYKEYVIYRTSMVCCLRAVHLSNHFPF
jgi:hypothetical protein